MDDCEIRIRCIEAAARNPNHSHQDGVAAAVLEQAKLLYSWVASAEKSKTSEILNLL